MGIPALIAAQAVRDTQQREEEQTLLDAFRIAGAVARDRAQSLTQLKVVRGETFNRFETARVLQLVGRNLYYLDEAALSTRGEETAPHPSRRTLVIAALVAVAVVVLAVLLVYQN